MPSPLHLQALHASHVTQLHTISVQAAVQPILTSLDAHFTVLLQLNYIAVIKSCKKRNRQLATGLSTVVVPPLRAVELLSQQYFFTSSKLASLSTEAEILFKV